jgi:biopolymer transport protein ExbD
MVQLPDSALAKPPDAQLENLVIIHLGQDGTAVMNQTEVSYLGLRHYLDVEYYRIDVQTTDNPQDTTIVIRAHKAVKGGMVQELIQICQEAGFENFALRAEENINSAPKYITPLGG